MIKEVWLENKLKTVLSVIRFRQKVREEAEAKSSSKGKKIGQVGRIPLGPFKEILRYCENYLNWMCYAEKLF